MTIDYQGSLFKAEKQNTQDPRELKLDQDTRNSPIPGSVTLYEQCFTDAQSTDILDALLRRLDWQQPSIHMHGREVLIPRKQVWMGDPNTAYRYSGKLFTPASWNPTVVKIKERIESLSGQQYNSVLCNLYRNGQDSVSWHADDESALDETSSIASISFGTTRRFDLKPKNGDKQRAQLELENAMLLIMSPEVQLYWLHQIPKTKKVHSPRVNLTFRRVKSPSL